MEVLLFVCLCRVVTDAQVEDAIREGACNIAEVGETCGAGTGCGACHGQIQEIIDKSGPKSSADHASIRSARLKVITEELDGAAQAIAATSDCR